MKRMYRIFCVLLTACLLLSMVPAKAEAALGEITSSVDSTDFVLVLDCSGSLLGNDRDLAVSACKMFVDLIPVENARVSVITISKAGASPNVYSFSKGFMDDMAEYERKGMFPYLFARETADDFKALHSVIELSSASDLAVKQAYKDRIGAAAELIGGRSPITHALAAALDTLETNGTKPGNGCVVLLTDGEMTSGEASESESLKTWVVDKADSKDWPIYCIDTNFGKDRDDGLLNEISKGSGYANGKMKSESAVEICGHFLEIFNHFMENKNGLQQKVDLESGIAEHKFSIPMLSSETNIVVAGSEPGQSLNIHKVEIYKDGSEEPIITVTENDLNKEIGNPATVMATVESGVYYCLKMLAPKAGDYILKAYGEKNTKTSILVYDSSLQEMDLVMTTDPVGGENPVTLARDQEVTINAVFSYADFKVSSTDEVERGYYEKQAAVLYAYDAQNNILFKDTMSIGDNGYHYKLKLNETTIPSDKNFRLAVGIEKNEMYRTGQKESNSVWFIAGNLPPVLNPDVDFISLQGHVNMELEPDILMGTLYTEADGDIMTYELTGFKQILSNGAVNISTFESGLRESTDAIWVKAGLKPGQFEATLNLIEAGSGITLEVPVKMEIQNTPLNCTNIDPIEVWTDYFPIFQSDERLNWECDLNTYFSDYENVPISYTVSEDTDSGLLEMAHADGSNVLQLKASGKELGKTSLTIVATQYAGDEVTDTLEITVPVNVKNGKVEFWKDNWIWFALAAGLIVLIVLIIIFLSKSTRAKGRWEVTYEENGSIANAGTVRISSSLPCGRKKKFMFHEMITQINNFADGQDPVIARVSGYLQEPTIRKIQIQGITFGSSGFIVNNIPKDESKITVEYLGRRYTKKAKVTGGRIQFTIRTADGFGIPSVLTITMNCVGK